MRSDDDGVIYALEIEVEEELDLARAGEPAEIGEPATWLIDPTDVERDEIGLRNILGAVSSLEAATPLDLPDTAAGDAFGR